MALWMSALCLAAPTLVAAGAGNTSAPAPAAWEHVGPWNIFEGTNPTESAGMGEAGTLASAASPAANPNLIYTGGHNNGVSSGILKTVDGGVHWTRNSKGMWDTRINGVWLHPDDPQGSHVFAATATGVYESTDGAESWILAAETMGWAPVSFREAMIAGDKYIVSNDGAGFILTRLLSGGKWTRIKAPGGFPPNMQLSTVITAGKTEVFVCVNGGLQYGAFDTPTSMTWSGPITSRFNGTSYTSACANAAVDPNDRDHFMYSVVGLYHMRYSKDGGKTQSEYTHVDTRDRQFQTYFVLIDQKGLLYSSTQSGTFMSKDKGVTWNPLHVMISCVELGCGGNAADPTDRQIDRIPHDFQNIIINFRGDGIALPSDQGLHIVDQSSTNYTLVSAVGDMHNAMSLSAIISPSKDGKSRNIIANMWDWNIVASWDDGASWPLWQPGERAPYECGEGGGGQGIGSSLYQIMLHHSNWFVSADGGHNYKIGDAPGGGSGFDYVRQAGSRTEPTGTWFYQIEAPATWEPGSATAKDAPPVPGGAVTSKPRGDAKAHAAEKARIQVQGNGMPTTTATQNASALAAPPPPSAPVKWMMASTDFGATFSWTKLPAAFGASDRGESGAFIVDPTVANSLYFLTTHCLAHSTDNGKSWSDCSTATGLTGPFEQLLVKDSTTMFMLRAGAVPLRTKDFGKTWTPLRAAAPLFVGGATFHGSLSWTGKTMTIHGTDHFAKTRQVFGSALWKSTDDGDSFTDETADLVTLSTGNAVWYENDFYWATSGEGIIVKRNFE